MTTTAEDLAAATRMGRRAAEAGRPVTECPYSANGDGDQRALARRWVHGYLGSHNPMDVDVSFDEEPASA